MNKEELKTILEIIKVNQEKHNYEFYNIDGFENMKKDIKLWYGRIKDKNEGSLHSKYIVRIDGDITIDAELFIKEVEA